MARSEKFCLFLALLYVVSPLDLVPDVLPVLGWLDDVGFFIWACSDVLRFAAWYSRSARSEEVMGVDPPLGGWTVEECAVCLGERGAVAAMLRPCCHRFCALCAHEVHRRRMACPMCRRRIDTVSDD